MPIADDLNAQSHKEVIDILKKTNRALLLTILKNSPREEVIRACKDLKILKTDYNPATDKLELMEREP